MQENSKILYKTIAKIIKKERKKKWYKYTLFCYENDIPTTTYDNIINVKSQATFFNIAKIIKALGFTFEDFGKILDKELPENLFENDNNQIWLN